jgi:microcystin synthetase protein McyG
LSAMIPESGESTLLDQTAFTQPAIFSIQYALWQLWKSWGIEPSAVFGHSVGEYAAACAAGVFGLEDGLHLIATRGKLMQSLPDGGEMYAVSADEATVAGAISGTSGEVSIAAINSPEQTVISGSATELRKVTQKLQADGIQCGPLTVSHAFHSSLMDPMLDEFEQACGDITFESPKLLFVSDVHGRVETDEVARADYWRQQIREPVRFADAMTTLEEAGCNVFLEIGPKPILTALGRQCLADTKHIWLSSLRAGKDDWSQLLESVAQLYVNGVDLDWQGFDEDYGRRKISLPTYPFQRKRYWFEGSGASETQPTSGSQQVETLDAHYEVQWQPMSRLDQNLNRRPADYLPHPAELAKRVAPEVQRLQSQLSLKRNQAFEVELDRLSAAYVRAAFRKLGWQPTAGEQFTTAALAQQLSIVDQHGRLFGRMLDILAEEGVLQKTGNQWEVSGDAPPEPDPAMIWSIAAPQYPDCNAELDLLKQCGENLAAILNGSADPLQVLFPNGSAAMVENLYRQSPFARTLNTLVEESLAQALKDLPKGRTVKILEIGAGTGGTTTQLLPRLPADRTEYVFTDVSEIFTRAAEKKFRDFPFLRYEVLDVETDPREQGFADEQFDIIIAANVLHATQNLQNTINHVHQLLAPQGILLLLEGTRKQRWLDLIFGLTEGWWRFSDSSLRSDHALLSETQWTDLIGSSGFAQSLALPGTIQDGEREVVAPQSVIVSQKSEERLARADTDSGASDDDGLESFLIFSDRGGVGECLAGALRDLGHECLLAFNGKNGAQIDETHIEVDANNAEAILKVFDKCRDSNFAAERVVYLWGIDSVAVEELTAESLVAADVAGCHGALSAVQALVKSGLSGNSKFWLATRGAQAVAADTQVTGLSQSPIWGLGRVISEELPALWGGLIDLDPQLSNDHQANILVSEILKPDEEDQIAYRCDQRFTARLVPRESNTLSLPMRWRVDGSYLFSGGLGELGLRVARWMAERGAKTIVLFGRSEFPARAHWDAVANEDEKRAHQIEELRRIEALGARVRIASVDVANEEQLSTLLDSLAQEGLPPIRGVVHAAGLAEAQTLLELDHEQLDRVMRSKTIGTWLLHKLLEHERLDFFVSFSSGAALLGSPMLGSYAAANSFLDAIAHHRKRCGQAALSVNWGFWAELGMVARSQREIGRGFAPQGMQSFTPDQGLAAMQRLLEENATQTTFMPVDWNEWAKFHPRASGAPLLRQVLASGPMESEFDQSEGEDSSMSRDELLSEPAERQAELVTEFLCGQLSKVLRIPIDELDVEQPLNNLGIDSLMAVELRNHVQAKLGVVIPVAQLLQDPSISQLSQSLLERLISDSSTETKEEDVPTDQAKDAVLDASTNPPESPSLSDAMAQVEDLSEEEIDRMLNDMLK